MGRFFRRFFRYAFHLAAGCSALALVGCLILWPLSYRLDMGLGYATSGGSVYSLASGGGRLWVQQRLHSIARPGFFCGVTPLDPGSLPDWSYTDWKHEESADAPVTCDYALGGEWYRCNTASHVGLPLLYPTLLSAMLPAFWLRGFVRRRRQARLARPGFPVEPAA